MIQGAPHHGPHEETIPGLAVRMLNINFGSIHTSFVFFFPNSRLNATDLQVSRSIFMTHVLFEIALLPPEDVESMRTEIRAALESEGGDWNKASLLKMWKIDSALREVGRFYGLGYCEFFVPPCLSIFYFFVSRFRSICYGWFRPAGWHTCSSRVHGCLRLKKDTLQS